MDGLACYAPVRFDRAGRFSAFSRKRIQFEAEIESKWAKPAEAITQRHMDRGAKSKYSREKTVPGLRLSRSQRSGACSPSMRGIAGLLMLFLISMHAAVAHAAVALLMEEPYGDLGAFDPTGHSAVYLNHVCAASPTKLRACQPGEFGVVISRYHRIGGYDWIAIPIIPYLYSVDESKDIPASVDKAQVAALRDAYRRKYLESLAPDDGKGRAPRGDWTQLVGSSYDRTIHGFQLTSTAEQDARFIAIFNDRRNKGRFNALFHNCADFSRVALDIYVPHAVHRSIVADLGIATPKQVAKSLVKYGRKHPEVEMSAFVIPQVPGSVERSHSVDGVAESLVKSKKYLLPMAVLSPELTGAVVVAYLSEGRMKLPRNATVFNVDDLENGPEHMPPPEPATPAGDPSSATPLPASSPISPAPAPAISPTLR